MLLKRITILIILALTFPLGTCISQQYPLDSHQSDNSDCETGTFPQMTRLPILKNTWQVVHECDLPESRDVALAIVVFADEWAVTFGKSCETLDALHELMVEWSSAIRKVSGYYLNGQPYVNREVVGLALSPRWIWIKIQPGKNICSTSFVHELVHVAIWAIKETDGDPDHEGNKYPGWSPAHTEFVKRVNETLCQINL